MEWTNFIKDSDMSGAFVNSVMKLQVLVDPENLQTRILVHVANWLAINNINKLSFLNNNNNNNNNNNVTVIFLYIIAFTMEVTRDSSFGIAKRYGLDCPRIESRCRRDFRHPSRPNLRPTRPPVHWVPGVRWPGRGVDHPLLSVEDRNMSQY